MAKELDTFLDGEDAGQAEAEPSAAVDSPAGTSPAAELREPTPNPAPVAEPKEDDAEQQLPEDVIGLQKAIQAERAKRKDYKGERDRLQGEMAALKAQIEAAAKAPPPAPVQAQPAVQPTPVRVPNPVEDPEGYAVWQDRQRFSDKLDISEDRLREQVGDDADVDAKIARFKELVAANPALGVELKAHRHPYKFAYDYVKKTMAMEEIGDPVSYREKLAAEIRAEERAKIEAEYNRTTAGDRAPTPRVNLPQSLATARSAAPRSAAVINVAEDFADILRRPARK